MSIAAADQDARRAAMHAELDKLTLSGAVGWGARRFTASGFGQAMARLHADPASADADGAIAWLETVLDYANTLRARARAGESVDAPRFPWKHLQNYR